MTFYHDTNEDALIENHPDDYIEYDEEGRLIMDIPEMRGPDDKLISIYGAVTSAMEERDVEPYVVWTPEDDD